jgi:hypothetical protein
MATNKKILYNKKELQERETIINSKKGDTLEASHVLLLKEAEQIIITKMPEDKVCIMMAYVAYHKSYHKQIVFISNIIIISIITIYIIIML